MTSRSGRSGSRRAGRRSARLGRREPPQRIRHLVWLPDRHELPPLIPARGPGGTPSRSRTSSGCGLLARAGRLARIDGRQILRLTQNPATEALYDQAVDALVA
jgi:hypothetical protein